MEDNFLIKNMKLHHLGYACNDIDTAIEFIKKTHEVKSIGKIIFDPLQNTTLCFITVKNGPNIELISGEPVKYLTSNGICLYHTCYQVDDIQLALKKFKELGAVQVNHICPAKLFDDQKIVFLQTVMGLIELLERKPIPGNEHTENLEKIILAGTFTTDTIKEALSKLIENFNFPYSTAALPYDSTYIEMATSHSELNRNHGINVILLRIQDFINQNNINAKKLKDFVTTLKNSAATSQARYIVLICPSNEKYYPIAKHFENNIREEVLNLQNLILIDAKEIADKYEITHIYDELSDKEAKVPYSEYFDTGIAVSLLNKIYAINHNNYKVVIVDCDNTLWTGICAEEPLQDLKISESNILLQKKLIYLHENGYLICLCSKNNEYDVRMVFEEHICMLLSSNHITAWEINWKSKHENIKNLSITLNLPLSSFIFIDDNPIECHEIRTILPDVLIINFINQINHAREMLNHLWAFEKTPHTANANTRKNWYESHLARDISKTNTKTLKEFINGLNLKIKINHLTLVDIPRVSELSYRVTQFNFSNKKYTENEIKLILDKGLSIIKVDLTDDYGDYGTVGIVIYEMTDNYVLIHSFMLSCRALNRGIEHTMINYLGKIAKSQNLEYIKIIFKKTDRNLPAEQFLKSINDISCTINPNINSLINTIQTSKAIDLEFNPDKINSLIKENSIEPVNNKPWRLSNDDVKHLSKLSISLSDAINIIKRNTKYIYNYNNTNNLAYNLASTWKEVLNQKEEIHNNSNFFELGGTSLLALRLASKIYEYFNIEIKLFELHKLAVFFDMLTYIKNNYSTSKDTGFLHSAPAIDCHNLNDIELASNQKGLWLLDRIHKNSWFYNISSVHSIRGELNIPALEKSISTIVQNNSSLRSFIRIDSDKPLLSTIDRPHNVNFKIIEAVDLCNNELSNIISDIQLEPFDLYKYPLYRIRLLKIDKNEHILILVFHHLIFDGWSEGLFNELISTLYKKNMIGAESAIKKERLEYKDFIKWEKQLHTTNVYKDCLTYWLDELNGTKILNFPTCYPRSRTSDHKGSYSYFNLPELLINSLTILKKDHNTTLFCILYTAFIILIYDLTKQEDITIGTTLSGRTLKEFENILGNFVSTIALRCQLTPEMTISELIANCHKKIFDAYENQFVPFQDIVKNISNSRTDRINPIYQIMLVLQDSPHQKLSLDKVDVDFYQRGYNAARMDIILEINSTNSTLDGGIYYNTSLFNEEFITNVIIKYTEILSEISKSQSNRIKELIHKKPHLPAKKYSFNISNRLMLAHKKFEQQVEYDPDKIAIKFNEKSFTYKQLNIQANKLANYLIECGISNNDKVALHVMRSEDIIIGILACFKIGATYIPIDPENPDDYKKYIINDCKPKCILTNTNINSTIHEKIIHFSEINKIPWQEKYSKNIEAAITQDTLAYIIYTSGTTGKPKGVAISHRSIINLVSGLEGIYKLSNKDTGLLFHSYCFDYSVWEMWSILYFGGSLIILEKPSKYTSDKLWSIIADEQISILNQTPTYFENILLDTNLELIKNIIKVRLLIFGGEALYPRSLIPWLEVFGDDMPEIYNMYGITETTVHVTYQKINLKEAESNKSLLGQAIPGLKIELFDENLIPVKLEMIGEIYVSGQGLSKGYINNKNLTYQRFITINGESWYRSGDLGRKTENCNIEYVGRLDNDIKIRGFRIDPLYISSVIEQHPAVHKSVAWIDKNSEKQSLTAIAIPDKRSSLPIYHYFQLVEQYPELISKSYILPNGMQIFHHNKSETTLQYQEIFIDNEYYKHGISVKDGDTIVDIGANIGMFSLFFGRSLKDIKVYAFEPIPELFSILKNNLWLYGIDACCLNHGISNITETANFAYYPNASVLSGKNSNVEEVKELLLHTLKNQGYSDSIDSNQLITATSMSKNITCDFLPLSHIIHTLNIDKIHLLKIDVENSELQVLEGIREDQWEMIDQIIVEVHDFEDNLSLTINILKSHGFLIQREQPKILDGTNIYVLYAKKNNLAQYNNSININNPIYPWASLNKLSTDIKDFLKNKIPDYMIPSKLIINNQIPTNTNGKIDLEKIRALTSKKLELNGVTIPNLIVNDIERQLLSLWKKVLKTDITDLETNFFDLGGDSFLLLKLHTYICDEILDTVQLIHLFSYTTIKSQSEFINQELTGYSNCES